LLACGKRLLAAGGCAAATPAALAAAADLPEATVRKYFKDAQQLFQAVLNEFRAATLDRWQAELPTLLDPLAQLHAITDQFLLATHELATEFRILQRALIEDAGEGSRDCLRAYFIDCAALLARVIRDGQQTGVCRRSLDPLVGAWQLIHTILGHALSQALALPQHQDDYLTQAADCLLHCLIKTDV
jgi:AcrR family transcriptional regulator